jgi:hypothetical protein
MQVINSKPMRPRNAGDDRRLGTAEGWRAASRSNCEGGSVAYAGLSSARAIETPTGSLVFGLSVEFIGAPCSAEVTSHVLSTKAALAVISDEPTHGFAAAETKKLGRH